MYLLQQNSNKPGLPFWDLLSQVPAHWRCFPSHCSEFPWICHLFSFLQTTHTSTEPKSIFSWDFSSLFSLSFCFSQCFHQRTPHSPELYLHIINVLGQMRTPELICWCFLQMPSRFNFGWNILSWNILSFFRFHIRK